MSAPKRKRDVQLNFRVSPHELELIETKMAQMGTINREAYLRKMAIDGYLCSTPEELFDKLLADFEGFREIKLTKGRRELTEDDHNQVRTLYLSYLKIREEESK